MSVNDKIAALRRLMKDCNIDIYVVPPTDPHMSEYVPARYKTREWLTGFTGSAGTAVVTHEKSGLWTDGRYFIQAENELSGSEIALFKQGEKDVPNLTDWVKDNLPESGTVGICGETAGLSFVRSLEKVITDKKGSLKTDRDLIGEIWEDRPALPDAAVKNYELKYAGMTVRDKLIKIREKMNECGATYYILSALDGVAWLYNIRGSDVKYLPVTSAYALIGLDTAMLNIDGNKLSDFITEILYDNGVLTDDYGEIFEALSGFDNWDKCVFDAGHINYKLYSAIPQKVQKHETTDLALSVRASKNQTEAALMRESHIQDGVAMTEFLMWLEKTVKYQSLTETQVSEKSVEFRLKRENNMGASFEPIAAYGKNAAMMHYKAVQGNEATLEPKGFFLIDCGGQYLGGTTDITRTVTLGEISDEERRDFTLVLKSHANLAGSKFMYGKNGAALDILARQPIWNEGMDYKCGTGHGIGSYLSVHEGPHGMGGQVKFEPDMVITIEPGIYKKDKHGIRTENAYIITDDITTDDGRFMCFEPLTMCPIDVSALDISLLTDFEIKWLNNYHRLVYEKLSPYLDDDQRLWLTEKTKDVHKY